MAAVIICNDFGIQENKSWLLFLLFSHLFAMKCLGFATLCDVNAAMDFNIPFL